MTENGNAAAMREALRTLRQRFDNDVMAYQDRYFKFSGWHWHKKAAEAAKWRDVFSELRDVCDAALSKPPRNCDCFAMLDDALQAHCAYCARRQTPQPHCLGGRDMTCSACLDCFADWLFTKAEGKEASNG